MAKFDFKNLSTRDRVVIGASAVALIALFLPWYGASAGAFSASVTGWGTSYGWLGGLLIVAAGALLLAHRAGVDTSRLRLTPAVLVLGTSALGTLIVLIRWVTLPSGHYGVAGVAAFSYGPSVGIILTVVVGLVQVVTALMMFRSSGEEFPWAKQASDSGIK
ncbi:MAG TPA: hypothetical protein VMV16_01290 [Solirubrobacteraceae bacterium]|nr:hypothetical protein [Solirubrobacteraceae bacterium]